MPKLKKPKQKKKSASHMVKSSDPLLPLILSLEEAMLEPLTEALFVEFGAALPNGVAREGKTEVELLLTDLWDSAAIIGEMRLPETKSAFERLTVLGRYTREHGANRLALILKTTKKQAGASLLRELRKGYSLPRALERVIARAPNALRHRAASIIQTELHTGSEYMAFLMAQNRPEGLTKTWNAIIDDRTRTHDKGDFDHLVMNGTTLPLDSPFAVPARLGSSEEIQIPGDPNGSAGNVINCRCFTEYKEI